MERIVALSLVSLLFLGQAAFGGLPLISNDAFVKLSVSSRDAVLPEGSPFGTYNGRATLDLFVASNSPYQVSVAFDGFVRKGGGEIRPEDTQLVVNNSFTVPVGREVAIWGARRTTKRGIQIPLDMDFTVFNMQQYAGGQYSGSMAVAVSALR
jgi:hypothetical protein